MIQDAYSGWEWDPLELGMPAEYESPTLDMIHDVSELNVVDLRELPSNQILVNIEAEVCGEFDVFVFKPDLYIADYNNLHILDTDWNDHYAQGAITLQLKCVLDLVVDTSDQKNHTVSNVSVELEPV